MDINHKQKSIDKPLKKLNNSIFTILLSIIAVVVGIQFGNILYKLDFSIIDSVDTENFRHLINLSLPIIDSVYNSGKSSVSVSGEVKALFNRIFGFDLDSPATILNAQSPIFMSYYRIQQVRMLSMTGKTPAVQGTGLPGDSNSNQSGSVNIPSSGGIGNGGNIGNSVNNQNTGTVNSTDGKNTGQNGESSGSQQGKGSTDAPGDSQAQNGNSGSGSGNSSGLGNGTGNSNGAGNGVDTGSSSGLGNGTGNSNGAGNGVDTGSSSGTGNSNGTGNSGGIGSSGSTGNSGQLAGMVDGTPESSMSFGTDYGFNMNTGITNNTNSTSGGNQNNNQLYAVNQPGKQPISSISYEIEDEKEGDEKDTVELDKIKIKNFTKHKIDIAKLLKEPLDINFSRKGPKVLIYHTHTSESYVLKEADLGKDGVPSFSSNPKYNVVRVGEELARHLKKYNIDTLHNGTVHDKVRDAAYSVSINTLQSYKKSYPSIQVYIDIHRDAVESDKPKLRITKEINGKNCAQIMFVVGADGMLPHPEWKENLKFVLKLQQKLNEKYPGLARPVWIVGKRYNQQISNQAILIEVGGDGNLLSECIESTKYLAEVLNDVMMEK